MILTVVLAAAGALVMSALVGHARVFHLGQMGFVGLGAYAGSLVLAAGRGGVMGAVVCATLAPALLGVVAGLVLVRARGDAFLLGSLGLALALENVAMAWGGVTGGVRGLAISNPFGPEAVKYGVVAAVAGGGALYVFARGRSLRALRDGDFFAMSIGLRPSSLRIEALVVASGLGGLLGLMHATHVGYVHFRHSFGLSSAVELLAMSFLAAAVADEIRAWVSQESGKWRGQAAYVLFCLLGAAAAALLFKVLPTLLRMSGGGPTMRQAISGGMVVLAMMFIQRNAAGSMGHDIERAR